MTIVTRDGKQSWESFEELQAWLAPWVAYLVTTDGEFVEIGWAPDMQGAAKLRDDYYGEDGLPEGHPHRFFHIMGVASHREIERLRKEHGA